MPQMWVDNVLGCSDHRWYVTQCHIVQAHMQYRMILYVLRLADTVQEGTLGMLFHAPFPLPHIQHMQTR